MGMLDNPVSGPLERYLDLAAKRQQLIVSNMANVDTPNYRTKDIDFQGELQRASKGLDPDDDPKVVEVQGLTERPDGNNVDLDREGLLLAKTQLEFRLGTQLLKHTFQGLMDVIKGGSATS
jgi:flagellar basal-body rod protein FlgB